MVVLQQSGVAHQPLSPNDILLFIIRWNGGKKKQTVLKPKVPNHCFQLPAVHNVTVFKLQLSPAVSFLCGIWKGTKAFFFFSSSSSEAGRQPGGIVSVVAFRLRTGQSHLPISTLSLLLSMWLSNHSFVETLLWCQDRSYFRGRSWLSSGQRQREDSKTWQRA